MGPAAIPIAVGVGVGGVASGFMQKSAQRKAAHEAGGRLEYGAAQGRAAIEEGFGGAMEEFDPWLQTGKKAQNIIADLSGANGPEAQTKAYENFKTDPSYKFALEQGGQALQRSGLSRNPNLFSGNFAAEAEKFGQGLATQQYGDYYRRLLGLSDTGYSAAGNRATLKSGKGTALANVDIGQASQMANLDLRQGQNEADFYNNVFRSVSQGAGLYAGLSNTAGTTAPTSFVQQPDPSMYRGMSQWGRLPNSFAAYGTNQ